MGGVELLDQLSLDKKPIESKYFKTELVFG